MLCRERISLADCTDSADEAGKQRRACVDGLGRLVMVVEPNPGAGATTATGSVTINGSEQMTGGAATPGSASINISGRSKSACIVLVSCHTVWDIGTVTITVAGYSKQVSYGKFDTAATVAWNLSCAFHQDANSPVDAPCPQSAGSSTAVVVTARATGFASIIRSHLVCHHDPQEYSVALHSPASVRSAYRRQRCGSFRYRKYHGNGERNQLHGFLWRGGYGQHHRHAAGHSHQWQHRSNGGGLRQSGKSHQQDRGLVRQCHAYGLLYMEQLRIHAGVIYHGSFRRLRRI